ncbi:hypothetical protein [Kytococcus sp. Marseille-QA3725]
MGTTFLTVELVLGALLLLLLAWLVFSWWRRVRIAGGCFTALCLVRRPESTRSAIVRLGPRAVEFHSLWGAGTTPFLALGRTSVEMEWLDESGPATGGRWVRLTGLPASGMHANPCSGADAGVDVALSAGDGRALRAWQETLPPGHSFSAEL